MRRFPSLTRGVDGVEAGVEADGHPGLPESGGILGDLEALHGLRSVRERLGLGGVGGRPSYSELWLCLLGGEERDVP